MRFTENGPAIPNELLALRDQGEVVFFCGAGISQPAGLPNFFELTVRVMEKLGVPPTSKIGIQMAKAIEANDPDLAPPFDQIFGMLQTDYTAAKVEKNVSALLKTPRNAPTQKHEIVLRLSRDAVGNPFVVTTNFDLLFERARSGLKKWIPPMLPIMSGDDHHTGIVYLHGRLNNSSPSPLHTQGVSSSLVLGSGDFGRAYLADGWATTFIRKLLERRVVVLLGYSAGDPPIRYLLEGLHASTSARLRTIYAFERGEESEVESKWRDLGVTGIPFEEFEHLWETLAAWAERGDDPVHWTKETLRLTRQSPRDLKPYQRGQIAAIASTSPGAKAFAETVPPPGSEWLCVLDRNVRYAQPFDAGYGDDESEIDPLSEYGLDDDPPRPIDPMTPAGGIDLLSTHAADSDRSSITRLAGIPPRGRNRVPGRLWQLARWFETVAHQPAAIWWAARQRNLHPDLLWGVNRRLTGHGERFDDDAWRIWVLLSEIEAERGDDANDRWYDFIALLRRGGWTNSTFRAFARTIAPRLIVEPSARLPLVLADGKDSKLDRLVRFKVHCPSRHGQEIEIPDDVLSRAFAVVRGSLEHLIGLLDDTGPSARFFHLPAIEADDRPGQRFVARDGPGALFLWAVRLFERLAERDSTAALAEVARWPRDDRYFFDKFRLFAWKLEGLVSSEDVYSGLIELQADAFWDPYLQRDLLHLLRNRWREFAAKWREEIERRICQGPAAFSQESAQEDELRKQHVIGTRLGWLGQNNCALSEAASSVLEACRSQPDWRTAWEINADHDMDGRTGWIERRRDAAALRNASVSDVIPKAIELSRREHQMFVEDAPFEGLVQEAPARALAALAVEGRKGNCPTRFWQQLLSQWPEETPLRLLWLCGRRLAALPSAAHMELRFYTTGWIEDHWHRVATVNLEEFYRVWDAVFEALVGMGEEATASGIGDVRVGGRVVERSRKTLDHAINGPIGKLVEPLFKALGEREFGRDEGFPNELKAHLERCLLSVGEGADHAASLLGRRLDWLYYVDKTWAERAILPTFSLSSPRAEASWNGLLFSGAVPRSAELVGMIKAEFLKIFEERRDWLSDDSLEQQAAEFLVVSTYWNKNDRCYPSDTECRRALQSIGDRGRLSALWILHKIVSEHDQWLSFGKRFFADIWPQEARFQTGNASETMIRIAEDEPDRFPEVVSVILEYLRPVDHPDLFIFRQRRESEDGERETLARRWPREVLAVADRIIAEEPAYSPHELALLLNDIAEAAPEARTTRAWRRLHELVSQ